MGNQSGNDLCKGLEEVCRGGPVKYQRGKFAVVHHLEHALQHFELLDTEVRMLLHKVDGNTVVYENLIKAIL